MIEYFVDFKNANAHLFEVKLKIAQPLKKGQTFSLPDWIPGSYMIRDFAKNIVTITAFEEQQPVILEKIGKACWRITDSVKALTIIYQVYAWDLSVRSAHLDNQHAFFNGTSLFLKVTDLDELPHHVHLNASPLAIKNAWQVATAMPAVNINTQGFGEYTSENYQALIDYPFEIGDLQQISFDVFGVPHKMFFTEAPARVDWKRIANDVKAICETEVKFFGDEKPPFEQYIFMTFVLKNGFGGLEHLSSTALHCSHADLPLLGDNPNQMDEGYRTFLTLCCHEYFHCWNVKRIKPKEFIPLELNREVHTELLWFFEGVTSYYDELLLARAKVLKPEQYLDMLAQTITRVHKGQGRFKQSVAASSFDAWTKFYKQDENALNGIVSYYTKGSLVALALDFEIRSLTVNQRSLDDVMRQIWIKFGKTNIGITLQDVEQIVEQISGQSCQEIIQQLVYSTDDIPLTALLSQVGINCQLIEPYLHNEKGGYVEQPKERNTVAHLGVLYTDDPAGVKVNVVLEDSCAMQAGLSNGDLIIALDNIKISAAELDKTIARIPLGETVMISYFRRERLHHAACELTAAYKSVCYLSPLAEAENTLLNNWLNGHDKMSEN
ncbi:M61 family metallopeptidase [Aliikangiella maris]|uniref:PDZ domain-containing protein n=2 Tax=Aliikangiella maris TaxID=3162458 RepID=A0ABV3MKV0_9GAMM